MEILTIPAEADALAKRFEGIDRASFARTHRISGGAAMIYQHITGRRPMSIKAATEYAAAFQCALEDISPRIALEVAEAASLLRAREVPHSATAVKEKAVPVDISPAARALVNAIVDADKRGVSADAFNALRETLRLLGQPARPTRLPPGTFDVEDPSH
ncbi:hypothetical protein [Burkholderia ubonensis]|uniref:hypothetical protein n=1 Tax=Burkholderia ubonensis TaxID=101571 RepID=UPI0012F9EFFA|nr:hypothetical protein [Burkholderia ubonensis]